jgi:hypothetical protein
MEARPFFDLLDEVAEARVIAHNLKLQIGRVPRGDDASFRSVQRAGCHFRPRLVIGGQGGGQLRSLANNSRQWVDAKRCPATLRYPTSVRTNGIRYHQPLTSASVVIVSMSQWISHITSSGIKRHFAGDDFANRTVVAAWRS